MGIAKMILSEGPWKFLFNFKFSVNEIWACSGSVLIRWLLISEVKYYDFLIKYKQNGKVRQTIYLKQTEFWFIL